MGTPTTALVCSCNNVGSENIKNKISEGCTQLKDLCAATGAGTGCGSCRPEVQKILEEFMKIELINPVSIQPAASFLERAG